MDKQLQWIEHFSKLIYITIQSIILFHVYQFLLNRLGEIDAGWRYFLWFLITQWLMVLPFPLISGTQRRIWVGATALGMGGIAYFYFGNPYPTFLLLLTGAWFAQKRMAMRIEANHFFGIFGLGVFVFSLLFFFFYLSTFTSDEIERIFIAFLSMLFLTCVGAATINLRHQEAIQLGHSRFNRKWFIANGFLLLGIAFVGILSYLALAGLNVAFVVVNILFSGILMAILKWIFSFLPFLQEALQQLLSKRTTNPTEEIMQFQILEKSDKENPTGEMFQNALGLGVTLAVLAVVGFLIYMIFKRIGEQQVNVSKMDGRPIIRETYQKNKKSKKALLNPFKRIFQAYSDHENHVVRKEYRRILKELVKKEGLKLNNATVAKINQHQGSLATISGIYEKVRYGEKKLPPEEEDRFKQDVAELLRQIKQQNST